MIISHKHKFVFSRPLKVGSSSSQAMLVESGILGDEDVYTGYRDSVEAPLTPFQNCPDLTCAELRRLSPYPIPPLPVDESGPMPLLGHLTPTEMLLLGLITEDVLETYTFVSILREPIDRYLSAWFFEKKLQSQLNSFEALREDIENSHYPCTFLGKTLKDYFTCKTLPLPNTHILHTETLTNDLTHFIRLYGGKVGEKWLKAGRVNSWAKTPYRDWLPAPLIKKLKKMMQEDFEFYYQVGSL